MSAERESARARISLFPILRVCSSAADAKPGGSRCSTKACPARTANRSTELARACATRASAASSRRPPQPSKKTAKKGSPEIPRMRATESPRARARARARVAARPIRHRGLPALRDERANDRPAIHPLYLRPHGEVRGKSESAQGARFEIQMRQTGSGARNEGTATSPSSQPLRDLHAERVSKTQCDQVRVSLRAETRTATEPSIQPTRPHGAGAECPNRPRMGDGFAANASVCVRSLALQRRCQN